MIMKIGTETCLKSKLNKEIFPEDKTSFTLTGFNDKSLLNLQVNELAV